MAKNRKKPNQRMGKYPNDAEQIMLQGFIPASEMLPQPEQEKPSVSKALKRWVGASLLSLAAAAAWQCDAVKGLFV